MNNYIPYGYHSIGSDDINAVCEVLRSGYITQGPKIEEFERGLTGYAGAKYAVAVSSGTAALHIACLAANINTGSQVITTPITFAASANCVFYCGAKPVFADVQEDTLNIDSHEIERAITKKTKAAIVVHFAGHPCDLAEISNIAKKYKLIIIEDAAHALGAKYKDSKIGSCKYSDMTIFSFHPVKSITTGEGGAVLTNSKDLYEKLLLLRNHGITKNTRKFINPYHPHYPADSWYYEMQELGFNYRLTDIQAALGISQLKKLDRFIERRREIAVNYNLHFKNNPYFDIPAERKFVYSAYHLYQIKLKNKFKDKKEEIFRKLRSRGLGVQVHYIPVYLHPFYKKSGYRKGLCPKAEDCYEKELSLPLYPALKQDQMRSVMKSVLDVFRDFDK